MSKIRVKLTTDEIDIIVNALIHYKVAFYGIVTQPDYERIGLLKRKFVSFLSE